MDANPQVQSQAPTQVVPEHIGKAYYQACVILKLNPRASAVMSRYCLQEMLCHFWTLPKKEGETLATTIERVAENLSLETREAIELVGRYGNIDSQFQQDVRMMTDTSEAAAAILIDLVESLFEDFYGDGYRRQDRLATLREIAQSRSTQDPGNITTQAPPFAKALTRSRNDIPHQSQ